jgi:transcription elongation factor GreA
MRENAKAIGAAAEKGDLSENSEYKFALEERDLLRARQANLQQQLSMARALDPNDVPTDHVSVGSKVWLRHKPTGQMLAFTFLGPLEADIEQHIYNYKAPFAQEMMGRRVGDEIELAIVDPPGDYVITDLSAWSEERR